jgi:CHAT domain-containing protein
MPSSENTLVKPGVVVTSVTKGWVADRAGLKEGDVLTSWVQSENVHNIRTPDDVDYAEIVQRVGAEVTLKGTEGDREQSWHLPADYWGITTRPNFHGGLLSSYLRGEQLAKDGQAIQAIQVWRQLALSVGDDCVRMGLLERVAETATSARLWQEADTAYQQASDEKACLDATVTPRILQHWSTSFRSRRDFPGARMRIEQALGLLSKGPERDLYRVWLVGYLGFIATSTDDQKTAHEHLSAALDEGEKIAAQPGMIVRFLNSLAYAAERSGELHQWEAYSDRAVSISTKLASQAGLQTALGSLCRAALEAEKVELAEPSCKRLSEDLALKAGPASSAFAFSLDLLVLVAQERGDFAKARALAKRALAIHRKLGDSYYVAWTLSDLGALAEEDKDYENATRLHLQALALQQKVAPNSIDLADTFKHLCQISRQHGDLDRAEDYCRRALATYEHVSSAHVAHGDAEHAQILSSLGDLARDRGAAARAREYYLATVRMCETEAPWTHQFMDALIGLAELSRDEGQLDAAAGYYGRALDSLELRARRLGGSSDNRASVRARDEGIYRDYVDLLIAQNKPELAFSFLERSRGRVLMEMLAAAHVDIHSGGDPALLERERAVQVDITAKSERRIGLLKEHPSDKQIQALEQEIAALTSEYQDIEARLRVASPNYASLTQPQPLTAAEVREQVLDPDTLLLEYSLGKVHSHVFAITADSLQVFELPARSVIEKAARRVHSLLTVRNRDVAGETAVQREMRRQKAEQAYPQAARVLSRMILAPVAGRMKSKRLVIVADGALHYVPFAALPEPGGEHAPSTPLIVQHEVINLPSASVLAVLRQQYKDRQAAPRAVAVLADLVFDKNDPRVASRLASSHQPAATSEPLATEQDSISTTHSESLTRSVADLGLKRTGNLFLPRLRYSRQEAVAIQGLAPREQVLEAVDFAASRATATSPDLVNYRIVHFATHALINNRHPDLSGLVFSLVDERGNAKDGFLTLHDIYNLNLPAELVVLSACETGLGKEINGEGFMGLTRGFMYAGASRVVASLWNVSDAATAELMAEFYRGMEKDALSPAAALRSAQVKLWRHKRWSSPYYWSAFSLQGEWR